MLQIVQDTLDAIKTAGCGSQEDMKRDLRVLCKGWLWGCMSPRVPDGVDKEEYDRINNQWKGIIMNIQCLVIMLKLPDNGFCNAATRTLFESSEEDDAVINATIAYWAGQ